MINVNNGNTPSVNFKNDINEIDMKHEIVWKSSHISKTTTLITGPDWYSCGTTNNFTYTNTPPPASIDPIWIHDVSSEQDKRAILYYSKDNYGTNYFYTDCDIVYLNPDSSKMFYQANYQFLFEFPPQFNTSKVTNMNQMFYNSRINNSTHKALDLSNFDTSNVTDMHEMFNFLDGPGSIILSNWDTSKVTTMEGMFQSCGDIFRDCSLDLSSFDTSNVTNMIRMFSNAGRSDQDPSREIIYGPKFVNTSLVHLQSSDNTNGSYHILGPYINNKPEWANGQWITDSIGSSTFVQNP